MLFSHSFSPFFVVVVKVEACVEWSCLVKRLVKRDREIWVSEYWLASELCWLCVLLAYDVVYWRECSVCGVLVISLA